ncbi:hypothetical protein SL003B_0617 [Polymorphum gilvum SL003B-26A1]|uniref:Uncharacterized protein n=1 Tax=Polymorphum gilvum (strain LMG 25793 / CGMCC 1.9160 / SL003B-26A1) TaxID=991905 RepID=F2J4V8_POLGS|nr:hypothetical protein SL003B_0617 [Polymorphum gilvum SL003B-26A1]
MVEVGDGGLGRIRQAQIDDFSAESLHAFRALLGLVRLSFHSDQQYKWRFLSLKRPVRRNNSFCEILFVLKKGT